MVAALFSPSKDPFLLSSLRVKFLKLMRNWARTGVSVVVDRGRGSTTTNYEGLMMRVRCDIKRVNTMVRTCSEVVVHCPGESDYF